MGKLPGNQKDRMSSAQEDITQQPASRKEELFVFLFLTVMLAPFLTVGFIGAYGFAIWIYQIISGPGGG